MPYIEVPTVCIAAYTLLRLLMLHIGGNFKRSLKDVEDTEMLALNKCT